VRGAPYTGDLAAPAPSAGPCRPPPPAAGAGRPCATPLLTGALRGRSKAAAEAGWRVRTAEAAGIELSDDEADAPAGARLLHATPASPVAATRNVTAPAPPNANTNLRARTAAPLR